MTLWILFCRMTKEADTFFTFYAKNREQAERKAEEILMEYHYKPLELREYPNGFRTAFTYIPGRIEEDAVISGSEGQEHWELFTRS